MPEKTTTSSLRAVIDSPQNSPIVSVTNVSTTDALTIHLTCTPSSGSVVSKTVNLQSKQTKLVRACSTLGDVTFSPAEVDAQFTSKPESTIGMAGEQVAGISITTDGSIGDVAAFGFVEHADTYGRYFSAMNFADTGLLDSTGTVFAGVPVGTSVTAGVTYTPQVALTNFSSTPQTATIYLATSAAGRNDLKQVGQVTVSAKSSQLVSLPQAKGSPKWENSFIVRSSGQPGDVLSKMMFKTVGLLPNIELVGKDELDMHNAGDHPWSLENGVGSTLYLFNHSDAIRKVTVRIGSGPEVWLKIYDLHPNETKSIAIGDLIQSKTPDDKGYVFPQATKRGEVAWWAPGDGAPKVNGRVVQTDADGTMARNFSCGTEVVLSGIQWSNYSGYYQDQDYQVIAITPQPQFSVINLPQYGSCPSGGQSTSQSAYLSWAWAVGQPQMAQIVNGTAARQTVNLEGLNQGSTSITVDAEVGGSNGCSAVGTLQVTPPNSITSVSPMVYGGTGTVTIEGNGFYGTPTVTSQSGNITFTNAVTNNTTTITANYSVACGSTTDSVMLSFASETQPYAPYAVQLVLPNAPAPSITMGGTSVAGTTTSVVVGQQIALNSSVSVPNCMSRSSEQWAPSSSSSPGTPIGGYGPTSSSGSVSQLQAPALGGTYTFYWIYPSSSVQATYQYTMSGGGSSVSSPVVTATFNVSAPNLTMNSTAASAVLIDDWTADGACVTAGPYLVYGDVNWTTSGGSCITSGTYGFTGTPSGSASGGNVSFIQLVTSGNVSGGFACTITPGLDTSVPYPYVKAATNTAYDIPAVLLKSSYSTLTRTGNFSTYLMWQSSTTGSILVPIGYQNWGFQGSASCSGACSAAANWTASTQTAGLSGTFVMSSTQASQTNNGYPQWSGLVKCN